MSDNLHHMMKSKTERHATSFENALFWANAKARDGALAALQKLYALFRHAMPSMTEVAISETTSAIGLPQLSCRFRRADGERYIVLTPIKYLQPREPFPEGGISTLDPFAVLGLEIKSNSSQVQIGYLSLRLAARTEADLRAEVPVTVWSVLHLVNEAYPELDESLVRRLIERAFVQDEYGNA